MDSTRLVDGGFWSVYWYNGYIVGSEIARGLDIFELSPAAVSQNEIDAAKSVQFGEFNRRVNRSWCGHDLRAGPRLRRPVSNGRRGWRRTGSGPFVRRSQPRRTRVGRPDRVG